MGRSHGTLPGPGPRFHPESPGKWGLFVFDSDSFFFLIKRFFYFLFCWVFAAARAFLVAASSCSLLQGFTLWWLLLLWASGSRLRGLQQLQLAGSRAQDHLLWRSGLAAAWPWHVGSSWTRDPTWVPTLAVGFSTTRPAESPWFISLFCLFIFLQ